MSLLDKLRAIFLGTAGPDSEGRIRCTKCRNRVLVATAKDNGGLCGVCYRKSRPAGQREAEINARHEAKRIAEASIPVGDLDDVQIRNQLSVAIARNDDARIDELLATGRDIVSQPAKYASDTWIGKAISRGCSMLFWRSYWRRAAT